MRRRQGVALLLGIVIAVCAGIGAAHALDFAGTDSPTKENLDDRVVVDSDVNLPDTERQMRRDRSRGDSTERGGRRGRSRGEGPNCEGKRGLGRGENLNCDEGRGDGRTNGGQDGEDALNNTFPTFFSQVNESNLGFLQPRQKRGWAAFKIENTDPNDPSQATARRDAVELLLESLEPHLDGTRVDSREAFDKSTDLSDASTVLRRRTLPTFRASPF